MVSDDNQNSLFVCGSLTLSQYSNTVQKNTIHCLTTMLATSKNVLFPGHNNVLTASADDPTL